MQIQIVRATVNNRHEWRVYVDFELDRVFLTEQEAIDYKMKVLQLFNNK